MDNLLNVIDLSHHNRNVDLKIVKSLGIQAVIHKATQGLEFTDPMFRSRLAQCKELEMLFGAYHYGTSACGYEQALHFLSVANDTKLHVLDLEENPSGETMTITEAERFVEKIYTITGKFPGIYSKTSYLEKLINANAKSILNNCWLWLADYEAIPRVPPGWKDFKFWQFTDGNLSAVQNVVIKGCDVNYYMGNQTELGELFSLNVSKNKILEK